MFSALCPATDAIVFIFYQCKIFHKTCLGEFCYDVSHYHNSNTGCVDPIAIV